MTPRSIAVRLALAAALAAPAMTLAQAPAAQQGPTVKRTVLQKQGLKVQGQDGVMVLVEIPVGGREGRHTHPGEAFAYIMDGTLQLDLEGTESKTLKAGDSFFIPANKIHEGINTGATPVKLVASFVVPQGQPLTTPAK